MPSDLSLDLTNGVHQQEREEQKLSKFRMQFFHSLSMRSHHGGLHLSDLSDGKERSNGMNGR
jgi:hypothetical protein